MQNVLYENQFNLHNNKNEPVGGNHFHMNDVAQRLLLTQTQKPTWKRLIALMNLLCPFVHHSFARLVT